MTRLVSAASALMLLAACVSQVGIGDGPAEPDPAGLHHSLLVLDSHLDTPAFFHNGDYKFSQRGSYADDGSQVDLPRIVEGGLDGGFWVIFTRQGELNEASYVAARTTAFLRQMSIREFAAKYADTVELAFNAADAQRIHDSGKIVVYQSMENAYPLGEDLSLLESFYVGGLRMVGPVHGGNNQFSDSSTGKEVLYGGLSPLGEDLVREANRLGIIVDASHASDDALRDMIALSTTPVILSHSGPDGVYEHPRNVPDELLVALADSGGVIQVNAFPAYLEALQRSPELEAALEQLSAEFGDFSSMSDERVREFLAARLKIFKQFPPPRSTFEKYLEHLLYVLELVGPDHVGIGADWDGGGGVAGMEDVASLPNITAALEGAGYSVEDIANIWSGNLLRLMREVEAAKTATLASPGVLQ